MKGPRRTTFLAITVATLFGFLFAAIVFRPAPEPEYQGKKLSYWLKRRQSETATTKSTGPSPETRAAIQAIGTNAIPTLLRMLRAYDSQLKLRFMVLAEKVHIDYWSLNRQDLQYSRARGGFEELGPRASNSVPELVKIYDENISQRSRRAVVVSLMAIGPPSPKEAPLLVKILLTNAPTTSWSVLDTPAVAGRLRLVSLHDWAFQSLQQIDPEAAAKIATNSTAGLKQ